MATKYPSAYEVYITEYWSLADGGRYSSERVVRSPLNKDDAEALAKELESQIDSNEIVSIRKVD